MTRPALQLATALLAGSSGAAGAQGSSRDVTLLAATRMDFLPQPNAAALRS